MATETATTATVNGNSKIVLLIQKCLALANSPNEHEASLAMAKAQELLDKYNLSLAEVQTEEQKAPELVQGEIEWQIPWKRTLYNRVARQNFCQVIGSNPKTYILGRFPNVVATREMVEWLASQMERLASLEMAGFSEYAFSESGRMYRKQASSRQHRIDFLDGATARVCKRLEELNAARREAIPNMTALVLNLSSETEAFAKQKFPHTITTTRSVYRYSEGYSKGQAAGDQVSIIPPSRHVDASSGRYLGSGV